MRYALAILTLSLSSVALAQNGRPQMTWTGYVSGSATLYIQQNRVDVQGRDTGAVDRPDARFFSPLPAARTRVDAQVRRGRGRVEVVEQPVLGNEYSAIVQIDPPGQRPELYTIDFYWDAGGTRSYNRDDRWGRDDNWQTRGRSVNGAGGEFRWSGEVDHEVLIEIQGRQARTRVLRGQPTYGERFDFSAPLNRNAANLRLEDAQGRGRIEVVQQPGAYGNNAAIVRIQDEEGGRAPYSFRLVWDDASGYNSSSGGRGILSADPGGYSDSGYRARTQDAVSGGYARWSGRVDGEIRVTLQGNRAMVTTVSGRPVADMNVDFRGGAGIPYSNIYDVQLRKLRGRGEVAVIELPNERNAGLVFHVKDKDGGADFYEVEITWR